jgi:putative GTP pyrophosphokinase
MTSLEAHYAKRFENVLVPLACALEAQLRDYLQNAVRIDRITARAKGIKKFIQKAAILDNGQPKYTEPLRQIQDQIGARVVTFFLSDVARIAEVIEKYYRPIELRDVIPDSESEFGYFGKHYIFLMPKGLLKAEVDKESIPNVFEFQIKTLFQHAWSEADHDLGYKPGGKTPNSDQRRLLAYASAQAWGADRVFDELFRTLGR